MSKLNLRNASVVCALGLCLVAGCHRHRKTRSAPKSDSYADKIKPIVESKHIQVMKWPDFADYQQLVQTFYDDRNYELAWVDTNSDGSLKPSPQAAAFIKAFHELERQRSKPG